MTGRERREKLAELLQNREGPISGKEIAQELKVSRQIIVQDIALLRAENIEIVSTTKGYVIIKPSVMKKCVRIFHVKHTDEQMEDELLTIIDQGGKVKDVIVIHPIYGEIKAELPLSTRQDVYDFIEKVNKKEIVPLSKLTKQKHAHTVEAESMNILEQIGQKLREKNYLLES